MKALIIENNVIAQVVPDDAIFEVVQTWSWVTCPDDCVAYEWTYDGVILSPPLAEHIKPPTQEELFRQYDIAIELYLDEKAKASGYYDPLERIPAIDRACSYAGFANPYQAESQMFVLKRSAVWDYVYAELAKVKAGERELPTQEALATELDAKVWNAP